MPLGILSAFSLKESRQTPEPISNAVASLMFRVF
jgi:hypothetical protein